MDALSLSLLFVPREGGGMEIFMSHSEDTNNYHEMIKIQNTIKLRELQKNLPPFCTVYFRGISQRVSTRTLIAYAYDLLIFFYFVRTELFPNENLKNESMKIDILERIQKFDIESYLEYLTYYIGEDGTTHTNDERGKARKLSSCKSLFKYFHESELIKNDPASIVHVPKLHEKEIIRLEPNEVAELLDIVEYGYDKDSKHRKAYLEKNKVRDLALLTLLLGTGLRVSECVGLNVNDVDFDNNAVRIIRKGGKEAVVYFGDEVEDALRSYLAIRKNMIAASGYEEALFLSMQNKRLTVRSVEKLVKNYSSRVTSLKKITPHKLRSTYGTQLYQESNDIYLVASVLGHKDVNTTKKHYASMDDDRKRNAANIVKLREELPTSITLNNKNRTDEE